MDANTDSRTWRDADPKMVPMQIKNGPAAGLWFIGAPYYRKDGSRGQSWRESNPSEVFDTCWVDDGRILDELEIAGKVFPLFACELDAARAQRQRDLQAQRRAAALPTHPSAKRRKSRG